MQFTLENNEVVSLEIVRKARMKHTYLRVTPKGVIVSTNKRTSLKEIEKFVVSKSAWLSKHIQVMALQEQKSAIVSGNSVYFLGKAYRLKIEEEHLLTEASIEFCDDYCYIMTPHEYDQNELKALLNLFYKKEALKCISPMVDDWSQKMSLKPTNIGFRKAKSRWGSCSSQNSLSFNYYLMKLPLPIINYVVVHELAHIKEKNHSKNFWAVVEKYLSNYQEIRYALREFERIISMH